MNTKVQLLIEAILDGCDRNEAIQMVHFLEITAYYVEGRWFIDQSRADTYANELDAKRGSAHGWNTPVFVASKYDGFKQISW